MSTLKLRPAGLGSVFPAGSVARTWNVCRPSESPERSKGDWHRENAEPSKEHSKVEFDFVESNEKRAVVELVADGGPSVICVSGGA